MSSSKVLSGSSFIVMTNICIRSKTNSSFDHFWNKCSFCQGNARI